MQRDLGNLPGRIYDVAIVGGGIYGSTLAWEAASRGLSVVLVEKNDFASATSANSLKIIHGGFRYLQHLDVGRVRESMSERRVLMRIAPHLVHPLPVLLPTYGHKMRSREILSMGLVANDLLNFDRNFWKGRPQDSQKWIPNGSLIGKREVLARLPGVDECDLTGGVIFYDAQVQNSERLVLAFLRSAAEAGAVLANYAEVVGFVKRGERVEGVRVVDRLSGSGFELRARVVLNAAGPWAARLAGQPMESLPLTKAVNLVTRPLFHGLAVGLYGDNGYGDESSLAKKGSSLLFVAPWRDRSLIGTTYQPYTGDQDRLEITKQDVERLLNAFNRAYPPAGLQLEDVSFVHVGLLPAYPQKADGTVNLQKHPIITDHRQEGAAGLLSVIGVKYTTARGVAVNVINRVFRMLGRPPERSVSADRQIHGGEIQQYEAYVQGEIRKRPCGLGESELRTLIEIYGAAYPEVLQFLQSSEAEAGNLSSRLLEAQVRFAVRKEMAQKLEDVIFRRTDIGSVGMPPRTSLELCAQVMAQELGWSEARQQQEIEAVERMYQYG